MTISSCCSIHKVTPSPWWHQFNVCLWSEVPAPLSPDTYVMNRATEIPLASFWSNLHPYIYCWQPLWQTDIFATSKEVRGNKLMYRVIIRYNQPCRYRGYRATLCCTYEVGGISFQAKILSHFFELDIFFFRTIFLSLKMRSVPSLRCYSLCHSPGTIISLHKQHLFHTFNYVWRHCTICQTLHNRFLPLPIGLSYCNQ